MITPFRKGRRSPFAQILPWRKEKTALPVPETIFSEQQFQFELEKERSRVERRIESTQFALLLLEVPDADAVPVKFVGEIHERLRITDCLGWCDHRLGILLPETDRKGAEIVAANLIELGRKYELVFNPNILIFPDDDLLATTSIEVVQRMHGDKQWRDEDDDEHNLTPPKQSSGKSDKQISDRKQPTGPVDASAFSVSFSTPLWKRAVDIFGSTVGLIFLSPVFVIAALSVRVTSPGPVFFRQLREGKDGKKFYIYKFRTMCDGAESLKGSLRHRSEQDGPAFKMARDPRLTTVGTYLRRSCIDELPQLINVLKGDMSLVGPRPLPVDESVECEVWQRRRLVVLPGITCVWQARGDRNTKFSDWMRMDMEYLEKRSFMFDMKLIMETVFAVVLHRGSV